MVEAAVLTAASEASERPTPASLPRRRLLVLASKPVGLAPGQRFRLEQWAPHLARDHGIDLEFLPFESPLLTEILYSPGRLVQKAGWTLYDFVRRAGAVVKARRYDAVVVFREASLIGPAIYERLLARTGTPIIYDFDDSIWSPAQLTTNRGSNSIFSHLHFYGKTSTICRIAAAVTPGNAFLAEYALKRNSNVTVVPTSIELSDYPVQPELPFDEPFVICWTGSTSTLAHFEILRRALEMLASKLAIEVRVICNQPPERPIAGAKTTFVRWTRENEAAEIGASHVGIMPLPDNEVTRGKCGLKALQVMATGRPVVVSPVGMNTDLVRDGVNGFLASTPDDYVQALSALANDPALRRRMGQAARKTVEESYSGQAAAAVFARVVRQVTG